MSWLHRSFNHHRPGRQEGRARTPVPPQTTRLPYLPACNCRLATASVPSIKRRLVAGAVAVGVVGLVVVPVAVLAAIAMVAIIEASSWIGIERFALKKVFAGHGH